MVVPIDRDQSYWDRRAEDYDRSMTILGRPLPRMVELIGEAIHGATRVLEVAAGTGLVTPTLARSAVEVVATDYAPAMVERLRGRVQSLRLSNTRCEQADIYSLPFEPGSFDAVVAANVLHLVPDLPGALAAIRRVLRPGGRLVAPTFCHDETRVSWVVSRLMALSGFPAHRRFSAQTLKEAIEKAGVRTGRTETVRGLIPVGFIEGTLM
jgi:ubiquinone/menaquinone biosynthesis C-methylase UbiE